MSALIRVSLTAAAVAVALLGQVSAASAELPPGHEVDQMEACLSCHDLDDALGARVPHAPVVEGDCSSCHNPHVSRFEMLLRERPAALCGSCHGEIVRPGQAVVHRPVAEGRCADCHQPHGGELANLLTQPPVELCGSCHAEVETWRSRRVQHSPFSRGRCADCHDPHASESPALATKPGGAICADCHPVTAAFRRDHQGYPVETAQCQQCHDPHASDRSGLFRSQLHVPFEEGDCGSCHAAVSADDPFALTGGESELCGECHEEQVTTSREAPFPHASAGGGECTTCHNPHTANGQGLLRSSSVDLCTECHDPGGASSGHEGRYVSHGDLECATCHAPHGGDRPLLLQAESVALCGDCHSHEHSSRHPLGEETRDPRNGSPMTCLSCHGVHDAPYKSYLLGSGDRELCLNCHRDLGAQ